MLKLKTLLKFLLHSITAQMQVEFLALKCLQMTVLGRHQMHKESDNR